MKNLILFINFLFTLICVSCSGDSLNLETFESEDNISQIEIQPTEVSFNFTSFYDSITYPEVWQQYMSFEKKMNSCQIPDSIVSGLSTKNLFDICMRFPLKIIGNTTRHIREYYSTYNRTGSLAGMDQMNIGGTQTYGISQVYLNEFPYGPNVQYSWYVETPRGDELSGRWGSYTTTETSATVTLNVAGCYDISYTLYLLNGERFVRLFQNIFAD